MKRLLALPILFAAGCAYGWWSGLLYPVMTQAWSVFAPRPDTDETEADLIG